MTLTTRAVAFVDPNTQTTSRCHYVWYWDGVTKEQGPNNSYTKERTLCQGQSDDSVFTMSILSFTGPENIRLRISHRYDDPE